MKKYTKEQEDEARAMLMRFLKPGDRIYTILRKRSSSGMSRQISTVVFTGDQIWDMTAWTAILLGYSRSDEGYLKVSGAGMDMGFHVVYGLSSKLFDERSGGIGDSCPSNDHNNGERDRTPHKHSDGGYALRHSWL